MSHYTVLVIGEDYERQLAPYNEDIRVAPYRDYDQSLDWLRRLYEEENEGAESPSDEELVRFHNEKYGDDDRLRIDEKGVYRLSTYNPNSKWDWYTVGGRWRGYFKLKQGVRIGISQVGSPGTFDNPPTHDADVVYKGDVDIEGMRDHAGHEAGETWDKVHTIIDPLPEARPWRYFYAGVEAKKITLEEARTAFHEQPRCKALAADEDLRWFDVEPFQVSRERYVQRARDRALSTYAYVKDGEWFAPGEMGWWGVSTEEEEQKEAFVQEFNKMLDDLPDDTLLTLVDCHI